VTYTYSKITMPALPWTPTLAALRDKVEAVTGVRPNFVLCNYYRTGSDSVSWHADDEKELGPNPFISSVSLGAERDFLLKHRSGEQVTVRLVSGSLLVMDGPLQTFWQHSIPKTKSPVGGRINLTFRLVGATRRK
jgi:alkylated DNA repair dioxygenase AlkB